MLSTFQYKNRIIHCLGMRRTRIAALLILLVASLSQMGVSAVAGSGPVFPVMNTSETLPDGVYFRNSPHTGDYQAIYGYGVFKGESVQANCWEWGDAVGRYNNQVWYDAANVTRPSVNGRPNAGWINTHYVDDGMTANNANPAVPRCGATTTPPPPTSAPAPTPNPQTPAPVVNIPNPGPTQQTVPGTNLQGGSGNVVQNPTTQPVQGPDGTLQIAPSPPAIPDGASVYYSPFDQYISTFIFKDSQADDIEVPCTHLRVIQWKCSYHAPAPASRTLYKSEWAGSGGENSGMFNEVIGGRHVTTLAGWSLGRVGVLYFLHKFPTRADSINYIILFDPGSYIELTQYDCSDLGDAGCVKHTASKELAAWLRNPSHHLVILTGKAAFDEHGPKGPYGGIKQVYFPAIHGTTQAGQVSICSYGNMSHENVWIHFRGLIGQPPLGNCPPVPGEMAPHVWHS